MKSPATDRYRSLLVLGLLVAVSPGCARMKSNRRATPPPLLSANEKPGASAYDSYASRMSTARNAVTEKPDSPAAPSASLARSEELPKGSIAPAPANPVAVAVLPPGTREGRTTTVANRSSTPSGANATARANPRNEAGTVARDSAPSDPNATIRKLVAEGRAKLASLSSYQVAMNRQERVGDTLQPAEDVVLSIRRQPRSVRLEWPDGPSQGREALYSAEGGDGLLHVRMPGSLISRTALPPDSPLVLRNSRHPITEAGFEDILTRIEQGLVAAQTNPAKVDRFAYPGLERPADLGQPCHKIVRTLPDGETWVVYLDPQTKLPALIQGTAADGNLLERYVFRNLKTDLPDLASANAFDPDTRWGPSRGLLGRLSSAPSAIR